MENNKHYEAAMDILQTTIEEGGHIKRSEVIRAYNLLLESESI